MAIAQFQLTGEYSKEMKLYLNSTVLWKVTGQMWKFSKGQQHAMYTEQFKSQKANYYIYNMITKESIIKSKKLWVWKGWQWVRALQIDLNWEVTKG